MHNHSFLMHNSSFVIQNSSFFIEHSSKFIRNPHHSLIAQDVLERARVTARFIIFNAEFIVFTTEFIVFSPNFIVFCCIIPLIAGRSVPRIWRVPATMRSSRAPPTSPSATALRHSAAATLVHKHSPPHFAFHGRMFSERLTAGGAELVYGCGHRCCIAHLMATFPFNFQLKMQR